MPTPATKPRRPQAVGALLALRRCGAATRQGDSLLLTGLLGDTRNGSPPVIQRIE